MVINSSGKQHRDFIALHNVARAVYHFLFNLSGKWRDGLFNLGEGRSMSIGDVAHRIAKVYQRHYGHDIPVEVNKPYQKDPDHPIRFSIEKLIKTGFTCDEVMDKEILKTLTLCETFPYEK